ncbi:MAG: hypothetical protein RMJ87_03345 [Cytophagales bacterium]|nr:hypothetical protein [Bernardetiaceae bacterium]MDW8204043.1 hypothetical protein [Cytophagales bacterium]
MAKLYLNWVVILGVWMVWQHSSSVAQIFIPDSLHREGKIVEGSREGVWKFYAPVSRQLLIEGSYHKGKPEGKWFWYVANRVFFEQIYHQGLANGWGRWYAEGRLVREQWFRNGIADSAFAYYNPMGHYALRGMTNGVRPRGWWQVYFPNGNMAAEWHWLGWGAYHGASRWYYSNGNLFAKGHFLTGLAEGRWEFYAPDQIWKIVGNFKDGQLHGIWEVYQQGNLLHRLQFNEGNLEGRQQHYSHGGILAEESLYKKGRLVRVEVQNQVLLDSGSGVRVRKDIQGKNRAVGSYTNGLLEGKVHYWDASGVALLQTYRQGKPEGAFALYSSSGHCLMKGAYQAGHLDSLCTLLYPNGTLRMQGMLHKGVEMGTWQFFYPNGNLQAIGEYYNGLPHGKWFYYDPQGQLTAAGVLQNGCTNGEWLFYQNGQLIAKGTFLDGWKHGTWTDYFPNGQICAQGKFAYNCEHGEWQYFHSNSKPRQTEYWQAGRLLEISDFIAPNGKILPKGTFKKGNGTRLIYHEKRRFLGKWQLQVSGNYKDGLPEGRWRYYDRKGRLQKELIFVQGKPISE